MATITKRTICGKSYFYAVECQRVHGKPRLVWQKYIGTAQEIIQKCTRPHLIKPRSAQKYIFGSICVLISLAERLQLVNIIDTVVKKRSQGISIGKYMLMCAINRCVCPKSKNKIWDWYKKTVLIRLIPAKKKMLSSQRFWDNMSQLTEEKIIQIEKELTKNLNNNFGIDLRCLIYDTTNFFTFIDTFNKRNTLAQRGHNKQKRTDLRQINLALMVTKEFHIPLFHKVYEGNIADRTEFKSVINELIERYKILSESCEKITIVYDKGNITKESQSLVDNSSYHFVGSLVPAYHNDLLAIPLEEFHLFKNDKLEGVKAYRTQKEVFDKMRTIVITYSEELFLKQLQTLTLQISKRTQALKELSFKLRKSKRITYESAKKQVKKILSFQHIEEIIKVQLFKKRKRIKLSYFIDQSAFRDLQKTLLGKTILFTDQDSWSDEEIVLAYRGQYEIEKAFKQMKNPHFVSWYPMFHWTDQKIRVHAFYCVLALTLVGLLEKELSQKGIHMSVEDALESLNEIEEIHLIYPKFKWPQVQIETQTILTELDDKQKVLFDVLELKKFSLN